MFPYQHLIFCHELQIAVRLSTMDRQSLYSVSQVLLVSTLCFQVLCFPSFFHSLFLSFIVTFFHQLSSLTTHSIFYSFTLFLSFFNSFFFFHQLLFILLLFPYLFFAYLRCFFRVLTLRQLMLHIYMEHLLLMFLDHTQRRSTVGRTPLDE